MWRPRGVRGLAAAVALAGASAAPAQVPVGPGSLLDPSNPDLSRLQTPAEGLRGLPRDPRGQVDWMRALRQGDIAPRVDRDGRAAMDLLQLDILMTRTAQMPHVRFPHEAHAQWLACRNCHDGLFVPKAGANPVNMAMIFRGESCGVCHGRVAFTTLVACERCHSVPQPGTRPWW